jgi:hypothetical protein
MTTCDKWSDSKAPWYPYGGNRPKRIICQVGKCRRLANFRQGPEEDTTGGELYGNYACVKHLPAEAKVMCETCGAPTPMTGTSRCDGCWELEHRLADYLRRGGANARDFVRDVLYQAGEK